MIELMSGRRSFTQRSYGALIALLLLAIAAGSTVPHWHNDWNDQGCQLCHLRDLPSALSPVCQTAVRPGPIEQEWYPDRPTPKIESFHAQFSTRAPPASVAFTI
jgi:hypothetical protein